MTISKKLLSVLLSVAILVTGLIVPGLAVLADENSVAIWDGTIATGYASGEGTEASPYIISNGAQLALAINSFGKDSNGNAAYFKLSQDIYLNDVSADNWTETATNGWFEGTSSSKYVKYNGSVIDENKDTTVTGTFNGNIDGDGHCIYGLFYADDCNNENDNALIPVMNGGSVKNLGFDKARVVSNGRAAILAAETLATASLTDTIEVDRCYIGADVTVITKTNGSAVAGFFGYARGNSSSKYITISNSYVLIPSANLRIDASSTTNDYKVNAFIGETWATYYKLENVFSIAKPISATNHASRISAFGIANAYKNVYSTVETGANESTTVDSTTIYAFTKIDASKMIGLDVFKNMPVNEDEAFVATVGYPTLRVFLSETEKPEVWDGTIATGYASGEGTEASPYIISNGAQLALAINSFGKDSNGNAAYFKLDKDIYLNDISKDNWASTATNSWFEGTTTPAYAKYDSYVKDDNKTDTTGTFSGNIDGDGHRIYGLFYADGCGSQSSALIPVMSGGSVKNLGIDKARVTSSTNAAVLAADTVSLADTIEVDRCYIGADVTVITTTNKKAAAGFFGYARGSNATSSTKYIIISNSYALMPADNLCYNTVGEHGDNAWKMNAFIGETWNTYYKLENVYSIARPINATNNAARISAFGIADAFKNVYTTADVDAPGNNESTTVDSTTIYAFTNIDVSKMIGLDVFNNMPINGAEAFVATAGYPVLKVFDSEEDTLDIWDGSTADSLTQDESGNYLVSNGAELALALKDCSGSTIKLTKDIYLNYLDAIDWTTGKVTTAGYLPHSWTPRAFNGTIDGNGHTIYGLYIKNTATPAWAWSGAGLISSVNGTANIEELGIDKAYVYGPSAVSALVGMINTSGAVANFTKCYVGEDVTLTGSMVGGFVGAATANANIAKCYSLVKPDRLHLHSTGSRDAGFLGDTFTGSCSITDSYSIAQAYDNVGGTKSAQNVYSTEKSTNSNAPVTVIDEAKMKGLEVLINADQMPGLAECGAFVATESYPILKVFTAEGEEEKIGEVWNGSIAAAYAGGTGTEADPYIISKGSQLALAINSFGCKLDGTAGAYFKLDRDIYLNDVSAADWAATATNSWFEGADTPNYAQYEDYVKDYNKTTVTGTFSGNIDGDGHCIYGLFYADDCGSNCNAFIPAMSGGSVKNLGFDKARVISVKHAAVLAAGTTTTLTDTIEVDRCYIGANVIVMTTASGAAVGGFFGRANNGTASNYIAISNSYSLVPTTNLCVSSVGNYGSNAWKLTAFVGETWNTYYKLENVYSIARPINATNNAARISAFGIAEAYKNVYTTADVDAIGANESDTDGNVAFTRLDSALMQGDRGLDQMTGFDTAVWYAVKGSASYPQLRIRGIVIGDVDENGEGAEISDLAALRNHLIGKATNANSDYNRNDDTDICDLVALSVKAEEKATAEAEANSALLDTVYLSATGSDENVGTEAAPVATLSKAIALAKDGAEVVVNGTVAVSTVPTTDKTVRISGGTLDFSGASPVNLNTGLIFENGSSVTFADDVKVYANGNTFTINEGVTVNGAPKAIYGGGTKPVYTTNLTLKSGNFEYIYGGGDKGAVLSNTNLTVAGTVNSNSTTASLYGGCYQATVGGSANVEASAGNFKNIYGGGNGGSVQGNTNLTLNGTVNNALPLTAAGETNVYGGSYNGNIGGNTYVNVSGNVNAALDHTSHTGIAKLFGGSFIGTVSGSTNVTVSGNAKFNYIYGGGAADSTVKSTNVIFSGYAMSIYGGSTTGTVTDETNVTVNGGWVHQVFGGCEGASMTGNTNVAIKGGYIDRRIVGGCYNGWSLSWSSEYYVTGTCTVTLYDEATYNLEGDDHGITALSRHGTNHSAENGILVFENSTLYNNLKSELGIYILGSRTPAYDSYSIAE